MSKIPCNVIRDLMVLYEDDVCSEESRQMVDSHIKECEACRNVYQKAKQPLPEISLEKEEGEAVKGSVDEFWKLAQKAVKKFERRLTFRQLIIVGTVCLAVMSMVMVWNEWLQFRINLVPSEDVQVSELYELENGDIYCTFDCKEVVGRVNISDMKIPEGKGFRNYDQAWYEISFQYPKFYEREFYERAIADQVYDDQVSVVFRKKNVDSMNWVEDEEGNLVPDEASARSIHICDSIYYNGKNKEDRFVVWKEGQKIEPAPEEIEKKVRQAIQYEGAPYWSYTTRIIE